MILSRLLLLLLLVLHFQGSNSAPMETFPRCIDGPVSVNATLGSTVSITCTLRGALLGKFYVNNEETRATVMPIDDVDEVILTATILVDTLQTISIRCELVTLNGSNSSTGEIMVQGYLSEPADVDGDRISPSTVLLSWTAPFTLDITDVDPDISHYTVYITNLNTGGSMTIENVTGTVFNYTVTESGTFEVRVSAWNALGEGEKSEPYEFNQNPESGSSPTNDTECTGQCTDGSGQSPTSEMIPEGENNSPCDNDCIAGIIVTIIIIVVVVIVVLSVIILLRCRSSKGKSKGSTEEERPTNRDAEDKHTEQSMFHVECASIEGKGSDEGKHPTNPDPEVESVDTGKHSVVEIPLEEAKQESGKDESEQRSMPRYNVKRGMSGGAHPGQWPTYSGNLLNSPAICGEESCHDTIVREESGDQDRSHQKGLVKVYQTPQPYASKMPSHSAFCDSKQKDVESSL